MGVFNAGLPNNISPANLPIGAQMMMVPTAQLLNFADGSVWLQSGVGVSPGNYPDAARLDHVCIHGAASTSTAPTSFAPSTQIAADGAGVVLATVGANNSILRSTDFGATWAAVSITALTNSPILSSVVWTGSRFIVGGSISGTPTIAWAHSTTGAAGTWTAGTADTTVGSVTSEALAMAVNPSTGTVVAIAGGAGTTGQGIQRCTTGSTFSRVASAPLTTGGSSQVSITYGNGYFLACNGANVFHSTDDGATFTTVALPSGITTASSASVLGSTFVISDTNMNLSTATNPTATGNWTNRNVTATSPSYSSVSVGRIGSANGAACDGTRLVITGYSSAGGSPFVAFVTTDGVNWRKRHLAGTFSLFAPFPAFVGGGRMLFVSSSAATSYNRTSSIVAPDFVGIPYAVGTLASPTANTPVLYTRIK